MKSYEDICKELDAGIPQSAVASRSQAGVTLSYLQGWYVIDKLNKIFGQGHWSYTLDKLEKVFEGKVNEKHCVSYIATVNLSVEFSDRVPDNDTITGYRKNSVYFSDVGYGDGQDKNNPGKAHELAVKEAVTDGLKRCAKSLGMSLGLALYDKEQEYVYDDSEPKQKPTKSPVSKATTEAPKKETGKDERARAVEEIRNTVIVLEAQKKLTRETFISYIKDKHGASTTDSLSLEAAKATLQYVKELLNGGKNGK